MSPPIGATGSGAADDGLDVADERAIRHAVDAARASQASLDAWLRGLGDVAPATPSRLPGWTVGHVLTHLARNADGHVAMLAGRPQYPGGAQQRDADITAGATRPWPDLVADVAATGAALDRAWDQHRDWSGTSTTLGGPRPTGLLPLLRQREVEIHRVDIGLGYELADLPTDYVRRDLRVMEMLWRARRPMGLTPLPAAALRVDPANRLGWLLGRLDIEGVGAADTWDPTVRT